MVLALIAGLLCCAAVAGVFARPLIAYGLNCMALGMAAGAALLAWTGACGA